ncbi:SDR family NAD(P)-dependent oxidoreductase [Pyxidicoccus parkwayensis]|uniref:SDR family NAD(P)-dependent oxidoreductase n=1 Tax=Pyxidicoccus parkwayensis TaxID=2813578 RepID=A0ABX7NNN1_9BACT|nr:SDR family NAD(P)-dependent oxidoreductase [Pyxidicoccus parkwaysis]QSQ19006.1 SDR family NAD(P)-dependent oxidoreductase [Pyxidicoccus parkwaysis]
MTPTIVVCGHGPGISDAVARRFGKEGFAVALVARNAERLKASAQELSSKGINAKAFPCDLASPESVRSLIREVRASLGPIAVLHWNAYSNRARDLLAASTEELRAAFDVAVVGFITGVQESLSDLKQQKGAVLVTGGALAYFNPRMEAGAGQWGVMGLALEKAAQLKTVGLLHHRLAREGVYVGEVVVGGTVRGTAFDSGHGNLEASDIAESVWALYKRRSEVSINFP